MEKCPKCNSTELEWTTMGYNEETEVDPNWRTCQDCQFRWRLKSEKKFDIIDKVKQLVFVKELEEIVEGHPDSYDKVKAMSDKELKEYIGIAPIDVPKEVQEELFLRFVQSQALFT